MIGRNSKVSLERFISFGLIRDTVDETSMTVLAEQRLLWPTNEIINYQSGRPARLLFATRVLPTKLYVELRFFSPFFFHFSIFLFLVSFIFFFSLFLFFSLFFCSPRNNHAVHALRVRISINKQKHNGDAKVTKDDRY